jgi:tryptophan-rich sensory protein
MANPKKITSFFAFIFCLALPLAIGGLGGFFTFESVKTWYITLNKPALNPPNWIFGPVWTTLYVLMGIASFLVWQKRKENPLYKKAIAFYLVQLVLNLMWSFLFFYQQQVGLALAEIILLWLVIATNGYLFYKINKTAGLLFVPYLLWVSFATYLTYAIYTLN